ncbi:AraC family transcriptional regulator [Fibrivirga algicola]|uniref:AraC family transcriptional regulator n=1 Tax=Fibrivirga algicola TaxID=2950420 RepID=A0ABX0QDY1_9BACT|nr:AraC family transcriptional regulator [Fibrivirga algicola]ARK10608.1 AraC family transcriptional regulator [Fibrella sp. ES10-3-2-2]NID10182.1 AraC family transcriptional regulator [Fibrivirga algicola]
MKALYEKVNIDQEHSLLVKHIRLTAFGALWHYHPEYELTYILESNGKRFVGDHVTNFDVGDLVLIGPNLPHFWRNDDDRYDELPAEAIVVQFPAALDENLLAVLPESGAIRQLLHRSRYGLCFSPTTVNRLAPRLIQLPHLQGMAQVLELLSILNELSADREAILLASDSYQLTASEAETERMKRVLEFVLKHFRKEIRIEQIASVAGMAPAAFCRYFRKRTGKSFVEYLNELRISHARKLLTQADLSVSQVGFECGFNNISHFHRQFKQQTGTTPMRYQAIYRDKQSPLLPSTAGLLS